MRDLGDGDVVRLTDARQHRTERLPLVLEAVGFIETYIDLEKPDHHGALGYARLSLYFSITKNSITSPGLMSL